MIQFNFVAHHQAQQAKISPPAPPPDQDEAPPPKKPNVLGPHRGGFHHFSSSTLVRNTSRSILRIVSVVLALVWAQGKELPGEIFFWSQGKRRPRTIEVGRKIGKKNGWCFSETLKSCVTSIYPNVWCWSHIAHIAKSQEASGRSFCSVKDSTTMMCISDCAIPNKGDSEPQFCSGCFSRKDQRQRHTRNKWTLVLLAPTGSMFGRLLTYIYLKIQPHAGRYLLYTRPRDPILVDCWSSK